MLRARQKPQNRYHTKLGRTSREVICSPIRMAKITHMQTIRDTKDPLLRPCSPASRNREGSIPVIRPMKRQTDGSGYLSRKKASRLATAKKADCGSDDNGNQTGHMGFKIGDGIDKSSMTGL